MTAGDELTDAQNEAINELRQRMTGEMKPELYDDMHLFYRFCKARDFNVDQAELMLRKHLEWRKEHNVDNIISGYESKEVLAKYFPGSHLGNAKNGCPVRYLVFGPLDAKGIRKAVKFPDIFRHVIREMEQDMAVLKENSLKFGKQLPGCIQLYDVKDMSFSKATDKKTLGHVISLFRTYQDNYPERLANVYVINVSTYFSAAFNVVRNFLADSILKKIVFLPSDQVAGVLTDVMDADDLPAFLGGNKTDPDGDIFCRSFVKHCGPVPEEYFVNKQAKALAYVEGVKKLAVPRVSFREIELEVTESGSVIEWEFETKSRDIGFGLFFKEMTGEEEKIIEIVPLTRLDTDDFSETGIHKCVEEGIYVMLFDNSYSWLRSKEIYYRAVVTSPEAHEAEMSL